MIHFMMHLARRRMFATLSAMMFVILLLATPALAARVGNHQIAAHAGDREAKPALWKESEWENSVQAIQGAFEKGVRYVEIDAQLNRHRNAITPSTPFGILYTHHDGRCEEINSNGRGTGVWRTIATDDPALVDRCAERLANVLYRWNYPGQWIIEMKNDTGYKTELPKALYSLLKARGQRTTEIVSSLDTGMLDTLRNEAASDGIRMNLMRVYGAGSSPSLPSLDQDKVRGYKYINANVNDWFVGSGLLDLSVPNYAKSIGLYVSGWHWSLTSCTDANAKAVSLDLDIMMTDCISDMQQYGWR